VPAPIDYYFDFSSPYGYLVADQIDAYAERHGRTVKWRPFLLGVVFQQTGQEPLSDQPVKGDYCRHDWQRFARLLGVPYHEPEPFPIPTQAAARAFYWVADQDEALAKRLARALYHGYFAEGKNISAPETVVAIAGSLEIDGEALAEALETQVVKERLKAEVSAAIERGVFGSPTFIVDGEMFWGADRLWQIKRWIEQGGW
jgi:2-hydroxychromene-2-carboxylate isomerase